MEVIRIRKVINSKNLHIDELEKFMGQETEIIILPVSVIGKNKKKNIIKLAGSLKSGEDPLEFQKRIRKEWD